MATRARFLMEFPVPVPARGRECGNRNRERSVFGATVLLPTSVHSRSLRSPGRLARRLHGGAPSAGVVLCTYVYNHGTLVATIKDRRTIRRA